jgi:hypothetical protein
VWRVEVGWDGDGAFLGRGWPEFADVCSVEGGWFLVVRLRGRGLLTVKAFDRSCCLRSRCQILREIERMFTSCHDGVQF